MSDTENIRDFSDAIFRNSYALEVLAQVSRETGAFYAADLGGRIQVQPNLVTPTLERLARCGMVKELPRRGRRGIRYFERQEPESVLWRFARDLLAERGNQ